VVRGYNVGFGDAVLVSVPERDGRGRETTRHLLIDVGNLLAGEANTDDVFLGVLTDIVDRTGGQVDLYVMTHEHLDHVQGLLAASRQGLSLTARYAWLTGSAHPDYYEHHPDARKRLLQVQSALDDTVRLLQAEPDEELELMVRNNSAWLPSGALAATTADHVDHLRNLAPRARTHYVDRSTRLGRKHPFREAKLRVLAPEPDTSSYYGRAIDGGRLTANTADAAAAAAPRRTAPLLPTPPSGVDPGAYFDLVRTRRHRVGTRIREIDAANNNTSVVLEIEWRGWRLLFPGDAELRSWRTMAGRGDLRPVHFVKVSHHGSHNGTLEELFDAVLPLEPRDDRLRHALVSTSTGSWASVPDEQTLAFYRARCTLHDTREVPRGSAVEIRFPG
jgi:hypothetical protein